MHAVAGDDGRLYSDVKLYVLSQGQKGYSLVKKQRATRRQLLGIWDKYGYIHVARVDSMPAQLLTVDTCPDCTDMGSIDLQDGIQLAVVVHQPMTFMDLLQSKVTETTDQVSHAAAPESSWETRSSQCLALCNSCTIKCSVCSYMLMQVKELRGVKDHMVDEQENAAAAWCREQVKEEPGARTRHRLLRMRSTLDPRHVRLQALVMSCQTSPLCDSLHVTACAGAQIFCIKEVAKAVELDGAAYSDVSVVIVERKQTFRYSDVEDYVAKLEKLK